MKIFDLIPLLTRIMSGAPWWIRNTKEKAVMVVRITKRDEKEKAIRFTHH
jgi:hypothetical protein